MIVVSDTSPIRALAHLGRVDVLRVLFGEVLIPPAVHRELQSPADGTPPTDITGYGFIRVESPHDLQRLQQLGQSIDAGEAEALVLALERQAAIVLIDEAKARAVAKTLNLTIVGTLGVLVRAKTAGILPSVRPLIDSLEDELGFFISPQLRADVLALANE